MWACFAGANDEDFQEQLKLRPLQDGRVLARFSFTTTLKDAVPRSPSFLKEDDTRRFISAPSLLPSHAG